MRRTADTSASETAGVDASATKAAGDVGSTPAHSDASSATAATDPGTQDTTATNAATSSQGSSRPATSGSSGSAVTTTEGATGSGMFAADKVRYMRDLAPAREIQRLAIDLDDARIAVRFSAGAATVDVVSDPSSRLDVGWARGVEKTLRSLETSVEQSSQGQRSRQDQPDGERGGTHDPHRDQDTRTRLDADARTRWHDATRSLMTADQKGL